MNTQLQPGKLVALRGRDWVVLPNEDPDLLLVRPLGGSDDEIAGIYLPLAIASDQPRDASFPSPGPDDLGDFTSARMLFEAARLSFRNGAGPFRSLAKLSFRPRAYQMVPLVMALRRDPVRLLIADDVGVGKTVEALLILRELLERRKIKRFAVICLPHLCDQWQEEIRAKLDLEAEILRSNTAARLDRMMQGDASIFDHFPYQIISIDYIKSQERSEIFLGKCPEFVIVDEAHSCAQPSGSSKGQQQRHHLVKRIAEKPEQHLLLLTATPHSGKQDEFQSLLGMLKPQFEALKLIECSPYQRTELARHFIQRRRADVEKWMQEDTPFPKRTSFEAAYQLAPAFQKLFDELLDFCCLLVDSVPRKRGQGMPYWSALALLRGVSSSPQTGALMCRARLANLEQDDELSDQATLPICAEELEPLQNPLGDDDSDPSDTLPLQALDQNDWTLQQGERLSHFATRLEALKGKQDRKLSEAIRLLSDWLAKGFHAVVFCRYIETANYLGEYLVPILKEKHPNLEHEVLTSELPDDLRKQRIAQLDPDRPRILISTDCLSEGINLQERFSAVLHYDLPWNPNRLEQREGRVDRFGQPAPEVKACLLYSDNNPIDGIVLKVLLRKVREVKRATGINIPFPEDAQSLIDAIAQDVLRAHRSAKTSAKPAESQLSLFDPEEFASATLAQSTITTKLQQAAEREKLTRSIFAQNSIHADEIETDLRAIDEAIGGMNAVRDFVTSVLRQKYGAQIEATSSGYELVTTNLDPALQELLHPPNLGPARSKKANASVSLSFESPTPGGHLYLGRNHRFVETLCQRILAEAIRNPANTTAPAPAAARPSTAARAAVIRTQAVQRKTALYLFRARNLIQESQKANPERFFAERLLLWGYSGAPETPQALSQAEAQRLIREARAASELSPQARQNFLQRELALLPRLQPQFLLLAQQLSQELVDAHERFSKLASKQRFEVVQPLLPMDLLGLYLLLPEEPA